MAVTEQIGGVELSDYGLRLARVDGNMDMPGFKDIIDEHDFESNLLVLDEKNVKIKLIGFYANHTAIGTAMNNFKTKIQSTIKQIWEFTNHGFSETCVVKNAVIAPYAGLAVEIDLTLTITAA